MIDCLTRNKKTPQKSGGKNLSIARQYGNYSFGTREHTTDVGTTSDKNLLGCLENKYAYIRGATKVIQNTGFETTGLFHF